MVCAARLPAHRLGRGAGGRRGGRVRPGRGRESAAGGAARGHRRPVRAALERRLPGQHAPPAPARHVVIVGLSGLRWSDVPPASTPTLWRLAGQGSAGSLVDYAVLPLTCPADGWLTLNAGARAPAQQPTDAC